jgi:hypothetical protein
MVFQVPKTGAEVTGKLLKESPEKAGIMERGRGVFLSAAQIPVD